MSDPIQIGTRVKLKPHLDWISKWQRLADSGRKGTVVGWRDPLVIVKFDVIRARARLIEDGFLARDLDIIPGTAPAEQQPLPPTQSAQFGPGEFKAGDLEKALER